MSAPKKILLVEDDNNLREIYGARLQAEGYDIVSAPDGENALAIAVKEKPDLIISDIMMPKVSGFDMLDILRNAPETKDTKIIMMTALSQAEDKARAEKLGADMYLVKSQVTLEDVTKAVHKILDDPTDSAQEADSAAAQALVSGSQKPDETPAIETPKEETPQTPPAQESPVVQQPAEPSPPQPQPAQQNQPPQEPSVATSPTPPPQEPEAVANSQPPQPVSSEVQNNTSQNSSKPPESLDNNTVPKSTSIPVNISDDSRPENNSPLAVEPNLAQALEDEEKAVNEKIENFENSDQQSSASKPAPDPVEGAGKEPTIQDQSSIANSTVASQPSSSEEEVAKPANPLDDRTQKKVIQPINDPTKGPDINELIAKEEAREAANGGETNQGTNQVIKPESTDIQTSPEAQGTTDLKDDFGKISL